MKILFCILVSTLSLLGEEVSSGAVEPFYVKPVLVESLTVEQRSDPREKEKVNPPKVQAPKCSASVLSTNPACWSMTGASVPSLQVSGSGFGFVFPGANGKVNYLKTAYRTPLANSLTMTVETQTTSGS